MASLTLLYLFLLVALSAAGTIELSDTFGTIESPGYANPYSDNANQRWILNARPGYQIVLYFTTFHLEGNTGRDCVNDYVELEHLGSRRRLCGEAEVDSNAPQVNEQFRSEGNQMIVHFVSDRHNAQPRPVGFLAHFYQDDKDECAEMNDKVENTFEGWDHLIYCNHFCVNVPGSYYCSCRHGYVLHPNLHTCTVNCRNVSLQADRGQIQTPEYPENYPRLTDCDWSIEVREGMSLNLVFESPFDVEDHYNNTNCPYDYVKLSYGNREMKLCGSAAPNSGQTIQTNSRTARVEFHTDNSVEKSGFLLKYNTTRIKCIEHPRPPNNGTMIRPHSNSYFEFEDVVEFRCDTGFNMIGSRSIACQNDGSWSGSVPQCRGRTCGRPTHLNVSHSKLLGARATYEYLDVVALTCDQWYEKFEGTSEWICNENGQWVGKDNAPNDIPSCKPVCGTKNHAERSIFHQRIGGGPESEPNEWPWMAFINMGKRPNVAATGRTCGGALIGPNHVLTAAHCVINKRNTARPPNKVFVWLGVHDRQKDRGGKTKARLYRVAEVVPHPSYNAGQTGVRWDNDVAVLRLASSVAMDDDVRPICLPMPNTNAMDFQLGSTAGWGYTEGAYRGSIVLKHAQMPTVNNSACWQAFLETVRLHDRTMPPDIRLTDNMFCAGKIIGSQTSTCKGDSGGPFMAQTSDNKYRVYGVVSWGISLKECGKSLSYSVFADLHDNMRQWVEEQLE